jgi:hypothetical protein
MTILVDAAGGFPESPHQPQAQAPADWACGGEKDFYNRSGNVLQQRVQVSLCWPAFAFTDDRQNGL